MRATSGQLASKFALDCILAIFAFACPEPPEFLLFGAMITMNEECPKRLGQIPPRPRISKKIAELKMIHVAICKHMATAVLPQDHV